MQLGADTTVTVGLLVVLLGGASAIGVGLFRIARTEADLALARSDFTAFGNSVRAETHEIDRRLTAAETRVHSHANGIMKLEESLASGLESIRGEIHATREELLSAIRAERG